MSDYNLGRVKGTDGRGIVSIEKTGTSGLIDTYTITYTDGTTTTFVVKNGEDGSAITIDTALSSSSTNPVQNKVIKTALDNKSDSSHNHDSRYYTETEMDTKLSGKANTSHTHNITDVSNLQSALDGKADDSDIPTKTSDLTNDSGFLTSHQDISGKEDKSNKVSNWSSTVNNTRYPTEKLVKDSLDGKSDTGHTHTKSNITDLGDYIEKSNTSGLVKNDGSIDTNTYLTSHQDISGKVNTSDIANNLTTTTSGKVLDARQGKVLNDLIGDAISYINS